MNGLISRDTNNISFYLFPMVFIKADHLLMRAEGPLGLVHAAVPFPSVAAVTLSSQIQAYQYY